jgi:hypothetical protein
MPLVSHTFHDCLQEEVQHWQHNTLPHRNPADTNATHTTIPPTSFLSSSLTTLQTLPNYPDIPLEAPPIPDAQPEYGGDSLTQYPPSCVATETAMFPPCNGKCGMLLYWSRLMKEKADLTTQEARRMIEALEVSKV